MSYQEWKMQDTPSVPVVLSSTNPGGRPIPAETSRA